MQKLIQQSNTVIGLVSTDYIRSLLNEIDWEYRLIAIRGARGIGKTTLLRQHHKLNYGIGAKALYISLDDFYFTEHRLFELAKQFSREGGQILYIDEVHKYAFGNWAKEIKNIYDFLPNLKVVFAGSSIIKILNEQADLSRRALIYEMQGLSFREFLGLTLKVDLPTYPLEELIVNHLDIAQSILFDKQIKPLAHFSDYLEFGYYPFFLESKKVYLSRLREMIKLVIEVDFNYLEEYTITDHHKINRLLYVLASSAPFKPNISKLSERISLNRNRLIQYIYLLERGRLLNLLHTDRKGITSLQKPDKVYLENTNLLYALAPNNVNQGNTRETFFLNQIKYQHRTEAPFIAQIFYPNQGDFKVDTIAKQYTFEIGGRNKTFRQLQDVDNGYVVADDIEIGTDRRIPLWLFGLLY